MIQVIYIIILLNAVYGVPGADVSKYPEGNGKPTLIVPEDRSLNVAISSCSAIARSGQTEARSFATAIAVGLGPVLAETFCSAMVRVDGSTAEASAFSLAQATNTVTGAALSSAAAQALSSSVGPQIATAVGSALAQMSNSESRAIAQALVALCTASSAVKINSFNINPISSQSLAEARCVAIAQGGGQAVAIAKARAIVNGFGPDLAIAICTAVARVSKDIARKTATSLVDIYSQPITQGTAFAASSALARVVDQSTAEAAAFALARAGQGGAISAAEALAQASSVSFAQARGTALAQSSLGVQSLPSSAFSQTSAFAGRFSSGFPSLAISRSSALAQGSRLVELPRSFSQSSSSALSQSLPGIRFDVPNKNALAEARCFAIAQSVGGFSRAEATAIVNTVGPDLAIAMCSALAKVRQDARQPATSLLQRSQVKAISAAEALAQASARSFARARSTALAQSSLGSGQNFPRRSFAIADGFSHAAFGRAGKTYSRTY